jgi:putative mRNA 3-end processing factor
LGLNPLLHVTEQGLYCPAGDFFVDPWLPVPRAIVTHAHSDHASPGCARYLTSVAGERVLRARIGRDATIDTLAYGERLDVNGIGISLHPAGHILGSAQVRVEHAGAVWVVSGDYKVEPDPTCAPFENVRCHVFVSESTFGLPIFRWPSERTVFEEIAAWWRTNQAEGCASLLCAYALGKAQRVLAGVDPSIGPIFTHGAVEAMSEAYRAGGIPLPPTTHVSNAPAKTDWSRALIVAPPSAKGTPWTRRFGSVSAAFVSGWMRIRGLRRRRTVDRGFVLSDHADWPGLLAAIRESGAERILLTHGYTAVLTRWLREQGLDADSLATRFQGEEDDLPEANASPALDESDSPATL